MAIAIYARKSIERENSISCDTQIEYCKAILSPDERKEEILTFVDNGYTGANTDRIGFQNMMKLVERGKISKVVVYRIDRIGRSLSDFLKILNTLNTYNVKFTSSQEALDTASLYGDMSAKIIMVFAEFERQSTIERVTQAYAHRSELGFYMGGRKPYGFTLSETIIQGIKTKKFEPVKSEIDQIVYIFNSYAVEGVSLRRLMDNLILNNILPDSGSWSTAKLSTILKNPIYVKADNDIYEYFAKNNAKIVSDINSFDGIHGIQVYGKTKHTADDFSDLKVVVMQHEGIINSEVWLKCQRKLEKNKQIGNSLSNKTSWLGGKIVCGCCKRTMTITKGGNGTRYFSCTGKSHNRICKGPKNTIYAESLEDMAYELISEKLAALKSNKRKISTDNTNKINVLKNRISEIAVEESKIVDLVLKDGLQTEMIELLNNKAKNLSEEKKKILEKIDKLSNEEGEVISVINLSKKWKTASYEEKRAVCGILIDKIYINHDGDVEVIWNI